MSSPSPIFLVSRFRSGSSFLWNVFRQDPRYRCFYEPFHDNLPESVETQLPAMESHRGVTGYWDEYRSVRKDFPAMHRPEFGISRLYLAPDETQAELAQFIQHLIRSATREDRSCVIKCNRLDFRLPWLRKNFPDAQLIHMTRNPRDQWISSVRPHKAELWDRLEENRAYDLPTWIASLAPTWPFLLQGPTRPAYYYSYLLSKLSRLFGEHYAQHQLDFDRDVAEEPARFCAALAGFFPKGFFDRPAIKALFHPTQPGLWRQFRTAAWFLDLEKQAEATLRRAGVYKKTFWLKPAEGKVAGETSLRKAVDLALLTFSRHRGDLLVHAQQMQASLDEAKKYTESLRLEYDQTSQVSRQSAAEQQAAENKLRLLQAVYDSLKQAYELSVTSLNKTLEEFQFTTKELHQLIAYKDERIQQITRSLTDGQVALLLAGQPLANPAEEELARARQTEARLQQEGVETRAMIERLERELGIARGEAQSADLLKKHTAALEAAANESWAALTQARQRLAELEGTHASAKTALVEKQAALDAALERIGLLEQRATAQAAAEDELKRNLAHMQTALAGAEAEAMAARELQKHATALERATSDSWTELLRARAQLAELAAIRTTLENSLAQSETARDLKNQEVETARAQVGQLESSAAETVARLATAQSRMAELSDRQVALENSLGHSRAAEEEARRSIAELTTVRVALEGSLAAATQTSGQLRQEAEDARARIASLEHSAAATAETLAEARDEIDTLTSVRTTLEGSLAAAAQHSLELSRQLSTALELNRSLEQTGTETSRALAQLQVQFDDLTAVRAELEGALTKTSSLLTTTQDSLEAVRRQLAGEISGRAAEKRAYDERAVLLNAQVQAAHQQMTDTETQFSREAALLREQIALLETQLADATGRLATIEKSWARGLVRRMVPGAFSPTGPQA